MSKEQTEVEKTDNSIVPEKYRGKYRGAGDWLKSFVDSQVTSPVMKTVVEKNEDGEDVKVEKESARRAMDLDKLFDLAEANHIDARGRYGDQVERKNAPGRLRMTIGNMLRAAARHRHGLYDLNGEWIEASEEFTAGHDKTENPDGTKIAKAKPESESGDDAEAA